jgi:hypothetical protein
MTTGGMATRPVLILNPRDDSGFVDFANSLVADGAGTADELQRRLRERYPGASVRRRELSSEPTVVLYVYRDGHWIPAPRTGAQEE